MNKVFPILFSLLFVTVSSCRQDEPEPAEHVAKRTVIIYAVASNNLQYCLVDDKEEMMKAAPEVEGLGKDVRVLLYSVPSKNAVTATLAELTKDVSGTWDFVTLKEYDRETFSTDPERMRTVFDDVRSQSPSDRYGLILWSHGTGWIPNFSDHKVPEKAPVKKSFGADGYGNVTDYCDIHELAAAVPEGMFDYIWFDLCYMMGIEVAYQLRDKCDFIAGYPTEDWSQGMNYDSTLPMLAAPDPDLAGAADSFFDYYDSMNMAVTVTVSATKGLERLAAAAADIYAGGTRPQSTSGLQNYSRLRTGLYDFGQFTEAYLTDGGDNDKTLIDAFRSALDDVLVYAACSRKDFNGSYSFNPEIYSGFSCHFPGAASTALENYYDTLDWTKAANPRRE